MRVGRFANRPYSYSHMHGPPSADVALLSDAPRRIETLPDGSGESLSKGIGYYDLYYPFIPAGRRGSRHS